MTSIDDALQKAYARRGQTVTRRRSGGPHIRPSERMPHETNDVTPAMPLETLPGQTSASGSHAPNPVDSQSRPGSSGLPSMAAMQSPITVRFEPSQDVHGGVSIGAHNFAPTLELPTATLPITATAAPLEELPAATRDRVDDEQPTASRNEIAPHLTGARLAPAAETLPSWIADPFSYQVVTSDPTLNTWQVPAESILARGVTVARTVAALPEPVIAKVVEVIETPAAPSPTSAPSTRPASDAEAPGNDVRTMDSPSELTRIDKSISPEATVPAAVEIVPVLPAPAPIAFKAAWEVDNFGFPELCTRAMDQLQDQIRDAVNVLIDEALPQRPVVSIGSWLRGEGRSMVGMLLARALSLAGLRVALVDADFENPRLAEQLGLSLDGGWDPTTIEEADLTECCVFSVEDRVTLVPLNPGCDVDELVARQTLNQLVDRLAPHFQIILLDNGPGSAPLTQVGGMGRDVKLIVRDVRETSDDSLNRLVTRLQRQEDGPIFVIENFTAESPAEARIG